MIPIKLNPIEIDLISKKADFDRTQVQWDSQKETISSLGNGLFNKKNSSSERSIKKYFIQQKHTLIKETKILDKKSKKIKKNLDNSDQILSKITKINEKQRKNNRDQKHIASLSKKLRNCCTNISVEITEQNSNISTTHLKAIKLQKTCELLIQNLQDIKREQIACIEQHTSYHSYSRNYKKEFRNNPAFLNEMRTLKTKEKELYSLEKKLSRKCTFSDILNSDNDVAKSNHLTDIEKQFRKLKTEITTSQEKVDTIFKNANENGLLRSPSCWERLIGKEVNAYTPLSSSAEKAEIIKQQIANKKSELTNFENELGETLESFQGREIRNKEKYDRINDTLLSYISNDDVIKKTLENSLIPYLKSKSPLFGKLFLQRIPEDQANIIGSALIQQWFKPSFEFALKCNRHINGKELQFEEELQQMLNYAKTVAPADDQLQNDINNYFIDNIELANKRLIIEKYVKIGADINALENDLENLML